MIEFVPYKPEHLAKVRLQPHQEAWRGQLIKPGYAKAVAIPKMSWTGLLDGEPIGCAGFLPQWEGRVICWALFSPTIPKRAWWAIVQKIRREFRETLQSHGQHRVEITVPEGFGAGCRLATMLGFEVEGLMKAFGPDGRNHFMFAKVLPCA